MAEPVGEPMNIGLLLFIPYRYLETAVLAELKVLGHDVPISQARVFQRIGPNGSRMADLAEAAQVTKQTLTSIVDQLEARGYVRRTPDPADARARIVIVTPLGQHVIDLSRPVADRIEKEWEEQLGRARLNRLRQLLTELAQITDIHHG